MTDANRATLYLHIGMHKTGTTALQKFFSINESALAARGICYPQVGRNSPLMAQHDIANSLKGPPYPLRAPEDSLEEYLKGIRHCFRSFSRVLLSSEIFMRFIPAFRDEQDLDLSQLEKLASTAETVKVIVYLRRQDEYLESFYGQQIKHNLQMSFREFVAARTPNYFELCSELAAAFGKDNVLVRVYAGDRLVGGNIFSDFLSVFNLELSEEFIVPDKKIHPSILADEREFKLLVNMLELSVKDAMRFNKPLMALSAKRRKRLDSDTPGQSLFSRRERIELLQDCAAVNHRVATQFVHGAGDDQKLFPDITEADHSAMEVYPGLSDEVLAAIVEYIMRTSPELTTLLKRGVEKSLQSAKKNSRESARRLQAALQAPPR